MIPVEPTASEILEKDVDIALEFLIKNQGYDLIEAWRKIDSAYYGVYVNDTIN